MQTKPSLDRLLAVAAGTALVATLSAQSPSLTAAVSLPDSPLLGAAAGGQYQAAAALGSGTTLVVFADERAGDFDIFGLRVDAGGQPVDAVPFSITRAPGHQTSPKVVWNGQQWLCVYESEYDPGNGYFATQVRAQRVSSQGAVLDADPLVIGADGTGLDFAVASDGVGWAVLWAGQSAGTSDVRARRVTSTGTVLDPGGVLVQASPYSLVFRLGAAFAGGNYLFTWYDSQERGRRFGPNLAAIGPAAFVLPFGNDAVCGNGTQFLAAWSRPTPAFTHEVVVQRFTGGMVPVDAVPLVVSDAASPNPADVRAAWTGGQWLVSWTQAAWDARVARIGATSGVLDPGGVTMLDQSTGAFYGAQLAALPGDGALFTWHEARGLTANDVYAGTLAANGVPGQERVLSLGFEAQKQPRVASGDGIALVTLVGEQANASRILAWRIDALGRPLDYSPIVVATAAHVQLQNGGAAWNGSHFLVVWADAAAGQVKAQRLAADGTWLDPQPIAVQPGFAPDVAAAGGDFLVTALRYPSYPQFVYSYGVRVRGSDGFVLDNNPLLLGSSFATGARVVELGGRWLVATEVHWGQFQSQASISVHFVDPNGAVTAAGAMGILTMQDRGALDVASSGTSALLVAQTGSNWTNADVLVQRVLPDGSMPAPMQSITPAPNGQSRASVLWNGSEYVVTYETLQDNVWNYDFEPDVHAVRVSEAGVPRDPTGLPLWASEDHERRADGDGFGDGKALLAAPVFDEGFGTMRVQVRVQRPDGVLGFGIGTPGCEGTHGIDVSAAPVSGSSTFTVIVDRAPPNAACVTAIGATPHAGLFEPWLGLLLHFDPALFVLVPAFGDAEGRAITPLAIPANFQGFAAAVQTFVQWNGPCQPSPPYLSASPGLWLTVQ